MIFDDDFVERHSFLEVFCLKIVAVMTWFIVFDNVCGFPRECRYGYSKAPQPEAHSCKHEKNIAGLW